MKFPRLGMNTRTQPPAMPGSVSGIVTLQNVWNELAPRSDETSTSERSSFSTDA